MSGRCRNGLQKTTDWTDARVRIISGSLEGIEGTVVNRCRNDRLLIHLQRSRQGVCVEIDAQAVEFLNERSSNAHRE